MDLGSMTVTQLVILGFMSALSSLVMGKFLKRAIVMLISPLVRKTSNKHDDILLETAKDDWDLKEDK